MIFLMLFMTYVMSNNHFYDGFDVKNSENYQKEGSKLIIKGNGTMGPCSSETEWLFETDSIQLIEFEVSVKSIGKECFNQFQNVTQIEFKEGIETIEEGSFEGVKITQIQ